uniref:Uncharacterized protein n=1 Tax=Lates calcarifer TaxID=8187 RepID=A0A4W6DZK9_LATCA
MMNQRRLPPLFLTKGGWGRCGRVESKTTIHQTTKLKDCTDDCQYHKSGKYSWCHTEDGWGYCSSNPDHTYKDVTCRPNHKCGAYGQTYSWCYTTDNNDWDYCGLISTRECKCSPQHRTKRAPPQREIERRGDQNGKQELVLTVESVINEWTDDKVALLGDKAGTVIKSKNLRIDNQGKIDRDEKEYHNLQIQINKPRKPGESTTIAQITAPFGTLAEDMRWAFDYSLTHGVRVWMETHLLKEQKKKKKWRE